MESTNNLYDTVMSHSEIYSLMFSPYRLNNKPIEDQIVKISTEKLEWGMIDLSGDIDASPPTSFEEAKKYIKSFSYRWGWPGPDLNIYTANTYGTGWAFTKEEIINAWS